MEDTDKILKLLTYLEFTTNDRRLYKSEDITGYDMFYNNDINNKYYSALIGFTKISEGKYEISSLELNNGSLDNFISFCNFPYPSSSKDIYEKLQEIFKYELRKIKLKNNGIVC